MAAGLLDVLIVALAGMAGGIARLWVSGLVARRIGERFPWGTLVVNGTGALALGVIAALFPAFGSGEGAVMLWLALAVGILGSYTTVSSFSLQTLALLRNNECRSAVLNVAGSLALCLGAAAAGFLAVRWIGANAFG